MVSMSSRLLARGEAGDAMPQKSGVREYSAFISYRHLPDDLRVAKEIHRKLETYHLDRKTREASGFKSLAPIFRDADELPISSALDDDLVSALRNSSALIVVCSPRTNESAWVAREVDEFLKTHDQSRVFVALVEGQTHNVVPPRLQYTVEADGTHRALEPLAADLRANVKGAARRAEITRLAAGILAVPYDSLVRRAQRRRQRIISSLATAAVAASSAFGLYNSYMRTQIHTNYVEALRRRSEYLATEANLLMDEGNTLGATELALAALPDAADPQTAERPVVPEAVYALQQATNAGIAGTLADRSFTTSEVYVADSDLRKVSVSADEGYVTLIDETEVVSTWEVANHRLVFQERSSLGGFGAVVDAFALNSGATVVVYERGVTCRSGEDGSIVWEHALDPSSGAAVQAALVAEGNDRLLVVCKEKAVVLDLTTAAEQLYEVSLRELGGLEQETQWATPMGGACSTGTTFAFGLSMGDEEGFKRCVVVTVDAGSGQVRICEAPGLYAFRVGLLADGSVLAVLGSDPDAPISDRGTVHSTDYIDTVDFTVTIACMDAESASVRWAVPLTVWEVGFDVGFAQLAGQDGSTSGVVMCWICDHVLYLDGTSGEVLNSLECAASIVGGSLLVDGTSFMGIQADGSFFICTQESESVLAFRSIGGEAYYAKVMPSAKIFIIRHNVVYGYSGSVADASVVTTSVDTCRASWEFPTKDGFVTARIPDDANELRVTSYDSSLGVLWEQSLGGDELVWTALACDQERELVIAVGTDVIEGRFVTRALVTIEVPTGELRRWDVVGGDAMGVVLPQDAAGPAEAEGLVVGCCARYVDGSVFSQVEDVQGRVGIAAASLEDGTSRLYAVADGFGSEADERGRRLSLLPDPQGRRVFYQDMAASPEGEADLELHAGAVLDLATGQSERLEQAVATIWDGMLSSDALEGHAVWSDDGSRLAYVGAEGVVLKGFGSGVADLAIPLDSRRVGGMALVDDELVVALTLGFSGELQSYSCTSGEHLATHAFADSSAWSGDWTLVPKALAADGSGDLFVTTETFGYLVDLKTLSPCQRFVGGRAYAAATDTVLCDDQAGAAYSLHQRYSVQRLIDRGQQMLGPQTMGERWLSAHGA